MICLTHARVLSCGALTPESPASKDLCLRTGGGLFNLCPDIPVLSTEILNKSGVLLEEKRAFNSQVTASFSESERGLVALLRLGCEYCVCIGGEPKLGENDKGWSELS